MSLTMSERGWIYFNPGARVRPQGHHDSAQDAVSPATIVHISIIRVIHVYKLLTYDVLNNS